jgi:hypothetical protein
MFYELSTGILTTQGEIEVIGSETSGEVECVLVFRHDGIWVGLGSDHTDRSLEAVSVAKSKQVCAKVIAPTLWRLPDVADHWDRLELTSYIYVNGERTKYQSGTAAGMLPTQSLIEEYSARGGEFSTGTLMFCGTLATLHSIQQSPAFDMQLHDPVHDRTIRHSYKIHTLEGLR